MGLIKAALGAAGGVMADQWKEFFYCEAIPSDVLVVKGQKKVTGRSSNKRGDNNIITNGSLIAMLAVADVPYTRWVKFFGKLFAIIMVLSIIFVAIAASIGLGPF